MVIVIESPATILMKVHEGYGFVENGFVRAPLAQRPTPGTPCIPSELFTIR